MLALPLVPNTQDVFWKESFWAATVVVLNPRSKAAGLSRCVGFWTD